MARKQEVQTLADVQNAVVGQLEAARKRLAQFERELIKRGRAQEREIETLLRDVRQGKPMKRLEKQAVAARAQVKQRLDGLQDQVLGVLGVASRAEIADLTRELARLSKKVDGLASKKSPAQN